MTRFHHDTKHDEGDGSFITDRLGCTYQLLLLLFVVLTIVCALLSLFTETAEGVTALILTFVYSTTIILFALGFLMKAVRPKRMKLTERVLYTGVFVLAACLTGPDELAAIADLICRDTIVQEGCFSYGSSSSRIYRTIYIDRDDPHRQDHYINHSTQSRLRKARTIRLETYRWSGTVRIVTVLTTQPEND